MNESIHSFTNTFPSLNHITTSLFISFFLTSHLLIGIVLSDVNYSYWINFEISPSLSSI